VQHDLVAVRVDDHTVTDVDPGRIAFGVVTCPWP
jgi:hypothetical protein